MTLADLVDKLEKDQYPNEQAIKQSVVLRILHELQWNVYDPKIVWPEFNVNGSHVDFALCDAQHKPLIFIEVKQAPTFKNGEDQLMMGYAFKHGVPIAILTDGRRWSFYLPSGEGSFEDRRFYHLDLLERSLSEVESRFQRYLAFDAVRLGAAKKAAMADHQDATRKKVVEAAMPACWQEAIKEADAVLVAALIEKVETATGYRPQENEAADFLRQISGGATPKVAKQAPPAENKNAASSAALPDKAKSVASGENWYAINGQEKLRSKKAIDITVAAMKELAKLNPQILEKIAAKASQKGSRKVIKRRILAKTREELYDNPKMWKCALEIVPGWWLGTNYSNTDKAAFLSLAQKTATEHGISLTFNLV